jgi:ABC-type oligopeptide transport system substrate-binding subunit
VQAKGEDDWWRTPDGLAGTGPFRLAARAPGKSFDFVPVSRYWRGSPGALPKVHIGVEACPEAAVNSCRGHVRGRSGPNPFV